MKHPKKYLALISLLSLHTAFADPTNILSDNWNFEIAPYVWALNMNGNVAVKGQNANISQSFGDIVKNLNAGGMLYLNASKGRWTVALNSLYTSSSNSMTVGNTNGHANNQFGIFTPTIAYTSYQETYAGGNTLTISPYAGARVTVNKTKLTVGNSSFSDNQTWTDPLIGTDVNYTFAQHWSTLFSANIGGINTSNDYSYEFSGLVGYNPGSLKCATFYAGYQYLHQTYNTSASSTAFNWNMSLFGPVLGASFVF